MQSSENARVAAKKVSFAKETRGVLVENAIDLDKYGRGNGGLFRCRRAYTFTKARRDAYAQADGSGAGVGAGGAGFPTYAKLNGNAETIILNCAECEPLLRLHRQLLEKYAREIVSTFHMMGQVMGSKDIVIGIKKAYKGAIAALNECIGDYEGVRLGLLDEVYPAGDEVVLIYEVTGKVVGTICNGNIVFEA